METKQGQVGIFLFDDVEVLDFAGPFEVFSVTSAGISAGINMSFHIIKRVVDAEVAEQTAKTMEYDIVL
ncbi:hypothetical protein DES34_11579 [Brevibacillus brevis]|nr:hypothetical protein C7J99_09195 [Brevibacillus brevis]RED23105.1 hypothetical protein DES34_11579 [Brevibacillus brevis]GEC89634.1 hypothetical protein BBR01nite_19650 [Brevibacillus brevis]VEF87487.1 Uncharacterised protein [Brevibacillus brevis]